MNFHDTGIANSERHWNKLCIGYDSTVEVNRILLGLLICGDMKRLLGTIAKQKLISNTEKKLYDFYDRVPG